MYRDYKEEASAAKSSRKPLDYKRHNSNVAKDSRHKRFNSQSIRNIGLIVEKVISHQNRSSQRELVNYTVIEQNSSQQTLPKIATPPNKGLLPDIKSSPTNNNGN